MTQTVTIVGPNLPASAPADLIVHAAGCADLKRGVCKATAPWRPDHWTIEADSIHDVVDAIYGPAAGSFYEEAATLVNGEWVPAPWTEYIGEFHFAPCVDLPRDHVTVG